jgi:hypothetical protein
MEPPELTGKLTPEQFEQICRLALLARVESIQSGGRVNFADQPDSYNTGYDALIARIATATGLDLAGLRALVETTLDQRREMPEMEMIVDF